MGWQLPLKPSRLSNLIGGPPIRPAQRLWGAMADVPVQNPGNVDWSHEKTGRGWRGTYLALRLNSIRAARGRVAQEVVPINVIEQWAKTLGDIDLERDQTNLKSG
jgi:hypothetical protein